MRTQLPIAALTIATLASVPATALCQCAAPALGAAQEVLPSGPQPTVRGIADVNSDGYPDLLVSRSSGLINADSLHVLAGRGDGLFDVSLSFGTGETVFDGVLADMNADGFPDLVMLENTETSRITIRLNNGEGLFADPTEYTGPWDWLLAIYAADINADGLPDVLYEPLFGTLRIRLNVGGGALGPEIATDILLNEQPILLHDLTGDGRAEIILNDWVENRVRCFSDDGSGLFAAAHDLIPYAVPTLTVIDINGDGALDIAFQRTSNGVNQHEVWFNDGDGVFSPIAPIITPSASWAYADLNADGLADLIANHSGMAAVYVNSGGGTFAAPLEYPFSANTNCSVIDQNGDGILDLVGFRAAGFSNGDVVLLPGLGSGQFGPPSTHPCQAIPNARIAALADLNNDGLIDVIVSTLFLGHLSSAGELKTMIAFCPCPADYDGNGEREVADIFAFLSAWFAGCP